MQTMMELLNNKEFELKELLKTIEGELKHLPAGTLRCKCKNRKYNQYYWYRDETREKYPEGRFLRKNEQEIIESLSQKAYDQKLSEQILNSLSTIDEIRETIKRKGILDEEQILQLYQAMSNQKRMIQNAHVMTDEEYISEWLDKTPGQKNKFPFENAYTTEKGEIVRSKSEKIIADKLFFHQIPYVYEAELKIKNDGVIYPDFTLLDVRKRRVLYWEHFGMMDSEGYSANAISKIHKFEKAGIWPGEQLIFTMEAATYPLNTKNLDDIISHYFEK